MVHVFRLIALSWMALAVAWAGDGIWWQAAVCFTFGVVSYAAGEQTTR